MFIIAGLGNPSKEYEKTRHNVGFDVIDKIADKYGIAMDIKKHRAYCGKGVIEGQKVLLLKPQTFMNNSGEAIRAALNFYKLDPETQMLVIYDDISLNPGQLRVRASVRREVQAATMELKISLRIWGAMYFQESK